MQFTNVLIEDCVFHNNEGIALKIGGEAMILNSWFLADQNNGEAVVFSDNGTEGGTFVGNHFILRSDGPLIHGNGWPSFYNNTIVLEHPDAGALFTQFGNGTSYIYNNIVYARQG